MLLLYQTSRRTEGADVPPAIPSAPSQAASRRSREMPDVRRKGGRGVELTGHHEAGEIRHVQLVLHIDPGIHRHADEREHEAGRDKRPAPARVVARKRQDEQHHGARHVRRHGVQVRLHGAVAQARDDLRQEQLHALQRDAEADLDGDDGPAGGVSEDLERLLELELLVDDGGGVEEHARAGEVLLFTAEEGGGGARGGQVPVREEGEEDCAAAFDEEEIAPVGEGAAVDLEDAEGEQAREGAGDGLRGVEDREAAGQLAAAVERRLVVDHEWEEGAL